MRHPDRPLTAIGDLIQAIRDYGPDHPMWFRGQSNSAWTLVPSIGRNPAHVAAEITTIKVFKQRSRPYLTERPDSDWEWIFLMQHHRAPTRLLDWTESPLVGLYFAILEERNAGGNEEDGALWILDPVALNREAGHNRAFPKDILAFDIDAQLEEYLPDKVNARVSMLSPVAAIGPRNSPRMVAQSGTFTIMHVQPIPIEQVGARNHIWRMTIPAASKPVLREELRLLGVNEALLFPDLDRVAAAAREVLA
jgi:hypothetical protein